MLYCTQKSTEDL